VLKYNFLFFQQDIYFKWLYVSIKGDASDLPGDPIFELNMKK